MLTIKLNDWIKQIGKTANEICNNPDSNRIKLKTSDNGQHRVLSSNLMMLVHWLRGLGYRKTILMVFYFT